MAAASPIAENYRRIRERMAAAALRAHRDPASVRLIAVTKTVPAERVRLAVECGVTEIGESRLQESMARLDALGDLKLTWHFIGHLQTNKAGKVAETFAWVHSVDRLEIAAKLDQKSGSKRLPIMIEVKLGGEASKSGIEERSIEPLVAAVRNLPNLDLRGLMTIPPPTGDAEGARPFFRELRELARRHQLPELSMGMSGDFEVAIEEGATMVRVGTALFGERV